MDNKKLIREHTGEEAREVFQITGKGQVNDVFVVSTDASRYVIRIDPNESTPSRFQKEAWCMNQVKKLGVLVPEILAVGMKEGRPYILLSYIDGVGGGDANKKMQISIQHKLGEYARKINSVKVSGFGERMTTPGVFDDSWTRYLDYNISSLDADDKLLTLKLITAEQSAILKNAFLKLKNTHFNFGLVHNDLQLKNTIVTAEGEVYLLDWGSAETNVVPHTDIGDGLRSNSRLGKDSADVEEFIKGYGISKDEFKKIKPDILRLRLLTCTDKVRWALERKPELVEQKAKWLQKALSSFQ